MYACSPRWLHRGPGIQGLFLAAGLLSLVAPRSAGGQEAWRTMTGMEPGPNPVGFRVVELEDPARGTPTNSSRRIRAWLWYPAVGGGGQGGAGRVATAPGTARSVTLDGYLTSAAQDFTTLGGMEYAQVHGLLEEMLVVHGVRQEDLATRLSTPMLASADAPPGAGPYPLLVLGQGYLYESPLTQVALCEYLASHGFVVATSSLMGTDGPQVQLTVEDFSTQVADMALLLRRVPALLPVDPGRVGAGGFDLGGMAALLLQMKEPSIRALVSLDGGLIFPHNMALLEVTPGFRGPGLTVPTLQVTRDKEGNEGIGVPEDFRYFENATTEDLYLVRIPGMRHPDLTSFLLYATAPVDLPFWGPEVANPRQAQAQVARVVLDFLKAFVVGDAGARKELAGSVASGGSPFASPPSGAGGSLLTIVRGRQAGSGRPQPSSGWIPVWPSDLRGPWLGQPLPGNTPEIFAEGIIALGNHEHHLTASPDGREILWVIADKDRARHTLVRVVQDDGVWLPPQVAPFSGRYNDFAPSFYPDGSALLFSSNRPLPETEEPTPDANIWRVERTAEGWGDPYPLPSPVNDGTAEYNPSITADGLLVFQDHDEGGADLYATRLVDGAWTTPEKIPGGVNTPGAEITPFVSGDGTLLLFASDRPGGFGALDIWASRRLPDGGWTEPENLGEEVNTQAPDAVPTLSPDGGILFLTNFLGYGSSAFRDRSYGELVRMLRSATNGDGTLYWVSPPWRDGMGSGKATVPMRLDHNRTLVDGEMQRADGSWRPARLWVDTGNPDLFLSEALARDLGMDLSTAEGGVEGGRLEVPTPAGLRLGGMPLELDGVRTFVMFEPGWLFSTMHNDANLPSTVLRRYEVVFDYPARAVTVAQPGTLPHRGVAVPASIHPETGIVQMDGTIEGKPYSFALDLGASWSFTSGPVLEGLAREHPEWPTMQGAVGHANMWGWWPQEEAWTVMRIPQLRWGDATLSGVGMTGLGEVFGPGFDLAAWYSQKTARPVEGFLGPNAVRGYRVEIDYPNATVYFEEGPDPLPPDMDMVGLTLRPEADGGWTVLGIAEYDGRPSAPGVEAGDRLVQVDGLATTGATMGAVVDALRGNPGDVRILVLERGGERMTLEAPVRRFLSPRSR